MTQPRLKMTAGDARALAREALAMAQKLPKQRDGTEWEHETERTLAMLALVVLHLASAGETPTSGASNEPVNTTC